MEHILQFAVNIDDDHIIKMVEERSVKAGVDQIMKQVKERTEAKGYYSKAWVDEVIDKKVSELIEQNKEAILEKASERLAEKLARTKLVKQKLAEVVDSTIG